MLWLFLLLLFLTAQYLYFSVLKRSLNHVRIALNTITCVGCTFISANLFLGAFYAVNRTWGIPVNIQKTNDGVVQLHDSLESLELKVQQREAELMKLRQEAADTTAWEKVLHDRLYSKLIEIRQTSRLNPILLSRLGPEANIYSLDFSKTYVALEQVAELEGIIRQNILDGLIEPEEAFSALAMLKELADNLNKVRTYKLQLLERLAIVSVSVQTVQLEEPSPPEEPLPPLPNFEEDPLPEQPLPGSEEPDIEQPPTHIEPFPVPEQPSIEQPGIEPFPIPEQPPSVPLSPYARPMNISDGEAQLLWSGHKLVSDVKVTQERLATTVVTAVQKLSELMYYRQAIKVNEGSALYRVSAAQAPVTFLFMSNQAKGLVSEGDQIFSCRLGPLWCHPIGVVKALYYQQAQAPHPLTSEVLNGFLTEVELSEPPAAYKRVLHVHRPFFH